ncbi:MAG: GntR family transcriptional regulator [Acetobacteraceae bacterium]
MPADERSLCERYGAGRHTVRKALDLLVSQGVVARYVGRGSYITALPDGAAPAGAPAQVRDWSLLELTEAACCSSPGLAALVLERADSGDFKRLQQCIRAIEQPATGGNSRKANMRSTALWPSPPATASSRISSTSS